YLNALYPHANSSITGDKGRFAFAGRQVVHENFYTVRGDHKITDKDALFATYLYDKTPYIQPDNLNTYLITSQTERHIAAIEENHIFTPRLVNTLRLGFNRAAVINFKGLSTLN